MRRGPHVPPKSQRENPPDEPGTGLRGRLPRGVQRSLYQRLLKTAKGEMESYGLPRPDHKLLEAHPTISSDLLPRIGHGRITPKPNIDRLEGDRVRFVDGTTEKIHTIVYWTGYKISIPFFSPVLIQAEQTNT